MKRQIVSVTLAVLLFCGVAILFIKHRMPEPTRSATPEHVMRTETSQPVSHAAPVLAETNSLFRVVTRSQLHKRPNEQLSLEELEELGQLPVSPWPQEQMLAEKTTWWGRPLDAKTFWNDRPIWKDFDTSWAANSRGRQCPPVPFDDPELRPCSLQDRQGHGGGGIEGYTPRYVLNEYEDNFWAKWSRILPRPPSMIEDAQMRAARGIMGSEADVRDPNKRGRPLTASDVTRRWERVGQSAISDGCPPEAFERSAIYATFVLSVCQKQSSNALASWRGIVPDEYLDAPEAKLREMDKEWKRAYVARLEKELTNHPQLAPFADRYIKAYREAWGL